MLQNRTFYFGEPLWFESNWLIAPPKKRKKKEEEEEGKHLI
jgi:hypothetical protein